MHKRWNWLNMGITYSSIINEGEMKKTYFVLKKISDICFSIGKFLSLVAIFGILGVMTIQVTLRYLFLHPLTWPEGLCKVLFIWMSYLGAGIMIRAKGHIVVELFFDKFPEKLKKILGYVFSITILFTVIIFTIYSTKYATGTRARIYELGMISESIIMWSMPISGLFMIVHTVFLLFENLYSQFYKNDSAFESTEAN